MHQNFCQWVRFSLVSYVLTYQLGRLAGAEMTVITKALHMSCLLSSDSIAAFLFSQTAARTADARLRPCRRLLGCRRGVRARRRGGVAHGGVAGHKRRHR